MTSCDRASIEGASTRDAGEDVAVVMPAEDVWSAPPAGEGPAVDAGDRDAADSEVLPTETPTFYPPPGRYQVDWQRQFISVSIACADPGATIYYTTDHSLPSLSSLVYAGPVRLEGEKLELIAFAVAPGRLPSAMQRGEYQLYAEGEIAPPWVEPLGGTYSNDLVVHLTPRNIDVFICYTLDGWPPSCDLGYVRCSGSSSMYDPGRGLQISWSDMLGPTHSAVLRAIACFVSALPSQEAPSNVYTLTVADPTLTESTTLPRGSMVSVASITRGTVSPANAQPRLHYTLDGAVPTCASTDFIARTGDEPVYGTIGPLTTTTTVRAIGCKEGYNASNVVSRTYGVE